MKTKRLFEGLRYCLILHSAFFILHCQAALPRAWRVNAGVGRVADLEPVFHGEEFELCARFFDSDGQPYALPEGDWKLYYQTNGMDSLYYGPFPAAASSNTVSAVFSATNDPGAAQITGFLSLPGSIYHAAFRLRFLPSPGATPNALPLPSPTLNFATTTILNPPWPAEIEALSNTLSRAIADATPADYAAVSSLANSAVQPATLDAATNALGSRIEDNAADIAAIGDVMAYKGRHPHKTRCQYVVWSSPYDELMGKVVEYDDSYYPTNVWGRNWVASVLPFRIGRIALTVGSDVSRLDYTSIGRGDEPPDTIDTFYSNSYSRPYEEYPDGGLKSWTGTNSVGQSIYLSVTNSAKVVYTDELVNASNDLARAIADAAPADYANVSNLAYSALQSYTETDPTIYSWAKAATKPSYTPNEIFSGATNWIGAQGNAGRIIKILAQTISGVITGGLTVTASTLNDNNMTTYAYGGVAVKRNGVNQDYLFDPTSTNGVVRKSQLMAEAQRIDTITSYLAGGDAKVVFTNDSQRLWAPMHSYHVKTGGVWNVIWDEAEVASSNALQMAELRSALDDKADRAWGYYDSHTGNWSPDGYTWVSSPKVGIAGGLAYQRILTSEGAVWVLCSNGLVAQTGGTTNGYFRVEDDEGNAQLEIVKGDRRTVGANPASLTTSVSGGRTHLHLTYAIQSAEHPVLRIAADISNPAWLPETDPDCVANVAWTGQSGNWVAEVYGKSAYPALFVKGEFAAGGESIINAPIPLKLSHIYIGAQKYALGTADIDGHTVLTLTPTL